MRIIRTMRRGATAAPRCPAPAGGCLETDDACRLLQAGASPRLAVRRVAERIATEAGDIGAAPVS
jgi:hypothetical protein